MIHPTSETAKQEILDYAKEHLSVIEAKEILYKKGYYISKLFHVSGGNMVCHREGSPGVQPRT